MEEVFRFKAQSIQDGSRPVKEKPPDSNFNAKRSRAVINDDENVMRNVSGESFKSKLSSTSVPGNWAGFVSDKGKLKIGDGDITIEEGLNGPSMMFSEDLKLQLRKPWENATGGPWVIKNQYLVVQKWRLNFVPGEEKIQRMAVWVRLSKLPLEWVDVDLLRIMRGLLVEYEGPGVICFQCGRVGHSKDSCVVGVGNQDEGAKISEEVPGPSGTKSGEFGPWMYGVVCKGPTPNGANLSGKLVNDRKPTEKAPVVKNDRKFVAATRDGKNSNSKVEGSRFAILADEENEDTSENLALKQSGDLNTVVPQVVLSEISNRNVATKEQLNVTASKYLVNTSMKKSSFNKPFKENLNGAEASDSETLKAQQSYKGSLHYSLRLNMHRGLIHLNIKRLTHANL
ncbi:hypothetical protein Dsin_022003 [Dipteronia sinensis]|uniref:CCHC-type domain-containing protein n=1 Tax=Dipteronia sinensis TaxID=43782 RepID=A0AAE0A0Z5_9ROSI|nr:hypothetical protein Dsin_022003 [Dipteronia sinensis]